MEALIPIIRFISGALWIIIIIDILLRYFMDPFHPVRSALDSIVEPMLAPIRRFIPPLGGTFDISPIVLLIVIRILESVLVSLILSLS